MKESKSVLFLNVTLLANVLESVESFSLKFLKSKVSMLGALSICFLTCDIIICAGLVNSDKALNVLTGKPNIKSYDLKDFNSFNSLNSLTVRFSLFSNSRPLFKSFNSFCNSFLTSGSCSVKSFLLAGILGSFTSKTTLPP